MTTFIPDNNLSNVFTAGNYFTSHFFMGGEKFDTPHPEGYLFGENMDLNFLGNRPVQVTKWNNLKTLRVWHSVILTHTFWSYFPQFPYVTPAPNEPVKTLRSLVNIRKDTLRLVRYIVNIVMAWMAADGTTMWNICWNKKEVCGGLTTNFCFSIFLQV